MTMEMYDRSKTGIKVDYSVKADRLATEDGASPLTIYAKNSKGLTG